MVRANLLAAESDLTGPVNIGHGRETSVLELLDALRDVADRPMLAPVFAPERPGEVRRSCLDVTRARQARDGSRRWSYATGLRTILAGL